MNGSHAGMQGGSVRAGGAALVAGAVAIAAAAFTGMTLGVGALLAPIADLFAFAALFGIVYTLIAACLVSRFFARDTIVPERFPAITIVKPLHGDEWHLEEHLASFFEHDYPGPVQYLFGVHDAKDVALTAVDALRARYPDAHVTIVADARLYGPNRKIGNLVNMLEQAEHDVLCFADSDVRIGPDTLRQIVGALQQPGVGLVTCVYRGMCAPGFWPRAAAASTNYLFLPGVVTGLAAGLARPCFGQTIAITRATLDEIGGLAQFAHHLAEDHALGEAVRGIGASVAIPPTLVGHACVETTFRELFLHELRWSRTIRAADRLGHLGSALMHPLPFALLAALASGGAPHAWGLAGMALLARFALKWQTDRAIAQPFADRAVLPLSDLVQFAVFVASFFSSHVIWRGTRFRVDRHGLLSKAGEP
ncbi:bacteriohopanetetrol glucosamine biosynthesis glycosyltransferase HpnI [Burkholderia sp. Bp8963]|uniref:bacteriohopanetetrol glucosamine biosynthesis glycosyltransferase HpnI n=1 Tax=Burkholderia sp. Bp8963 TaxID=2184547 RepID=UPI0026CCC7C0